MPVVRDINLTFDMENVLRRQGIRQRAKLEPHITALLSELLVTVNHLHLIEPAVAYELYSITEVCHDRPCLEGSEVLRGSLLPSVLSSAKELAVVVCTIGSRLEEKATDCFSRNQPLRGLMLDGIGSAAVDSLAQEACQLVGHEASSRGYQASSPLSPGTAGWPVSEQWHLLGLVPAEQIGVRLTPSAVMVPRKSISMVIGVGPDMPTWTQAEACNRCSLKKTCHHRLHT